jgi:PAS domain S-box-containing protein
MEIDPKTLGQRARELLGKINSEASRDLLEDFEKLIEDHNTHKIELELQQEELRRNNLELEEKNRRLDDLFDNAPIGYFLLDHDGVITAVNATASVLFHKSKDLLVHKPFTTFIHPNYQDSFYFYWQELLEAKKPANVEISLLTQREKKEYFLVNSRPYRDKNSGQLQVRLSVTNISDLKAAEALRESERRYRLLFKNMINGMVMLKPRIRKGEITDFLFFRANAAFERITGLKSRELEGISIKDILPVIKESLLAVLRKTIIRKENQSLENLHIGNQVYVNIYSFIPDDDFVAFIIENVTSRVFSERERQRSEELLQTIFKILPVGVTITDNQGSIIDCNTASEELLGLKKEQHLVRHIAGEEWQIVKTDLTPFPPEQYASNVALRENRIVENVEMGILKKGRGMVWLNVSAAPIPLPDMGVAIVYLDITERVQAQEETEEKFRNIVHNSADAIIIVNRDGAIIEWNKGCEMIFGISRKEALGQKIWAFMQDILLPDNTLTNDILFNADIIKSALNTGRSKWFRRTNETAIRGGVDGKAKILQSVAFPVKSSGKYLLGIVARDITESKETENMLKLAKERAEEASYLKSQFLANISHEIRTPLNAIMGFTEILKEYPVTDTKFKLHLGGIEKSSKALMALISDILDLSSIEAGKMTINPTSLHLSSLIEDVRQIFSLKAEQKGLDFKVIIDANVPATVYLDEIRLRQILFNLVGNAVKFTLTGGITIVVSADYHDQQSGLVNLTIQVCDTGPGIAHKYQEAIFDPFFQKRIHELAKQEGTGLGLAISRRFAQMMRGELKVKSTPGKGSTFVVFLPDVPVVKRYGATAKVTVSSETLAESASGNQRELVDLMQEEFITRFGSAISAQRFMHREIWWEYDKVADILGFDEVISFTGLLLEIAARNDLHYLREFAVRLSREATSYNVIEINRMMASFEKLRHLKVNEK